jgi:hypothetical protein
MVARQVPCSSDFAQTVVLSLLSSVKPSELTRCRGRFSKRQKKHTADQNRIFQSSSLEANEKFNGILVICRLYYHHIHLETKCRTVKKLRQY